MVLDLRLSFQKGLLGRVVPYFFADAEKINGPGGLKDTIRQRGREILRKQHSTTKSTLFKNMEKYHAIDEKCLSLPTLYINKE